MSESLWFPMRRGGGELNLNALFSVSMVDGVWRANFIGGGACWPIHPDDALELQKILTMRKQRDE